MAGTYQNLPGIEVMMKDGGLILPETNSTESLLIIAPSNHRDETGKLLAPTEPTLVRHQEDLVALKFGFFTDKDGQVNELSTAWKIAFEGGARQIYLMALDPIVLKPALTGKPTADETYKGLFVALHDKLFGILEDFAVDHIVVLGAQADKKTMEIVPADVPGTPELATIPGVTTADNAKFTGNFALLLAKYCETQTLNNNGVIGYIGTTAPKSNSLSDIKAHMDALAKISNAYSGHVSVIAGPELGYRVPGLNPTNIYYTNGVITYAALVTTLRPESAPTNKPVYGVSGIHYNLSLRQLDNLSGNQFVSFRLKNGQIHVTDGITTAPKINVGGRVQNSDFIRLSTLRITQAAIALVREVADPFVGEPNNMPQRNALNAAIRSGLEAMKVGGALGDYRFSIISDMRSRILGQAKITLELVPAFELRKITVDVSLTPELSADRSGDLQK